MGKIYKLQIAYFRYPEERFISNTVMSTISFGCKHNVKINIAYELKQKCHHTLKQLLRNLFWHINTEPHLILYFDMYVAPLLYNDSIVVACVMFAFTIFYFNASISCRSSNPISKSVVFQIISVQRGMRQALTVFQLNPGWLRLSNQNLCLRLQQIDILFAESRMRKNNLDSKVCARRFGRETVFSHPQNVWITRISSLLCISGDQCIL